MPCSIPQTHLDLLTRPLNAVLVTVTPQGVPHTTIVWRLYDPPFIYICTMRETYKTYDNQRNPNVSLMILDPECTFRYLCLQGKIVAILDDNDDLRYL